MKINLVKIALVSGMCAPMIGVAFGCSNNEKTAHLVALNDLHGTIESYHNNYAYEPQIACLADSYESIRKQYPDSTKFITLGDNGDGSAIAKLTEEELPYDLLSYFGADYSVLGNHELYSPSINHLDPSKEDAFVKWGKLKSFLACNAYMYSSSEGKWKYCDYFKPYVIEKIGDLNVGIVGYASYKIASTTPSDKDIACADANYDKEFADTGKTGAQILQEAIDNCHEDKLNLNNGVKPDIVILAQHNGADRPVDGWYDRSGSTFKLINRINGIAASLEAHSHIKYNLTAFDKDGKLIPMSQAGEYGSALNHVTFRYTPDKSKVTCSIETVDTNMQIKKDNLVNKDTDWIKKLKDRLNTWYATKLEGSSKTIFDEMNNSVVKIKVNTPKDEEYCIPFAEQEGEEFPRASHFGTDYILDLFNGTAQKSVPAITAVNALIETTFGSGKKVEGALNNGNGFRKDLIASKIDENDEKLRYFKTNDFFDFVPFDNELVIFDTTVGKMNTYLTNKKRRGNGEVEIYKFSNYKVSWDKSKGDYRTVDEVYLTDNAGTKITNLNTPIIMAANSYVFNNHGFKADATAYIDLKDDDPTMQSMILDKTYEGFSSWSAINMIAYYSKNYKPNGWDLTNWKYNEKDYFA